jgi:hypothetical protein
MGKQAHGNSSLWMMLLKMELLLFIQVLLLVVVGQSQAIAVNNFSQLQMQNL